MAEESTLYRVGSRVFSSKDAAVGHWLRNKRNKNPIEIYKCAPGSSRRKSLERCIELGLRGIPDGFLYPEGRGNGRVKVARRGGRPTQDSRFN